MDEFARTVLGLPLDPWQRWAVIHGMELLPDGRPRFRRLLMVVARQNGKTHLLMVLTLFWLYVARVDLVLGTSTNVAYAMEPWSKAVDLAQDVPALAAEVGRRSIRRSNGEEELRLTTGPRYKIAASNRRGGRSLTVHRLIADETREQHTWDAYNAAYNAMNAVRDGQAWFISNQGDHRSVVLDFLRSAALDFIGTGLGDERLGLMEWSAPDGTAVDDPAGWVAANPNLGIRLDSDTLRGQALAVAGKGGEAEAGFRTEALCQRVDNLDAAIDPLRWADCSDPATLDHARDRLALVLDVAPTGDHASLVAAALLADGRVRVEVVAAWDGPNAPTDAARDLPDLVARVKPKAFGWFPGGPTAALTADLKERRGWPPRGVEAAEIKGETAAACMGLSEMVKAGQVAHSDDPLLNAQVRAAVPLRTGDRWVLSRRGSGSVDAVYAMAGAAHLARQFPPPRTDLRVIRARRR